MTRKPVTVAMLICVVLLHACFLDGDEVGAPDPELAAYGIYDDDTGDGVLNPGEQARLVLQIRNAGTAPLPDLMATVSTSNPYVAVTAAETGSCSGFWAAGVAPDEVVECKHNPSLQVSSDAPAGSEVVFDVFITGAGQEWKRSFAVSIMAHPVNVDIESIEVAGDGNHNGLLEPAEHADLLVLIRNTGTGPILEPSYELDCDSQYLISNSSFDGQCAVGGLWWKIAAGDAQLCGKHRTADLELSADAPAGTVLHFDMAITDKFNNSWEFEFDLPSE